MKNLIIIFLSIISFRVAAQTSGYEPGSIVASFTLKSANNKMVSLNDKHAKGYIVVFLSSTCPYSNIYEDRVIQLHKQYASKGYPVIAISPNDPQVVKGDSFIAMQQRSQLKHYPFEYLYDPGQVVTKQFGAQRTPHVFLISKTANGNRVEYVGAVDNDTENINADKVKYLENAVDALLAGKKPTITVTKAIGCSVRPKV